MSEEEQPVVEAPVEAPDEKRPPKKEMELPLLQSSSATEWRKGGASGCGTWGCVGGIILLVAMLGVGYFTMKETVWMAFDKRGEKLMTKLPFNLSPDDRDRLEHNLQRYAEAVRRESDPYPMMGALSTRVGDALADEKVSVREVNALNEFLESVLATGELPED